MSNENNEVGLAPYGGGHRQRKRRCSISGCDKDYFAVGYCQMHRNRVRRHGDPHVVIANENRKHVKLSAEKAAEIRKLYDAGGMSLKLIGDDYGVSASAIYKITSYKNWKNAA